jgi:hypothetical protein
MASVRLHSLPSLSSGIGDFDAQVENRLKFRCMILSFSNISGFKTLKLSVAGITLQFNYVPIGINLRK